MQTMMKVAFPRVPKAYRRVQSIVQPSGRLGFILHGVVIFRKRVMERLENLCDEESLWSHR